MSSSFCLIFSLSISNTFNWCTWTAGVSILTVGTSNVQFNAKNVMHTGRFWGYSFLLCQYIYASECTSVFIVFCLWKYINPCDLAWRFSADAVDGNHWKQWPIAIASRSQSHNQYLHSFYDFLSQKLIATFNLLTKEIQQIILVQVQSFHWNHFEIPTN